MSRITSRHVAHLEQAHTDLSRTFKRLAPVYCDGLSDVVGFGGIAAVEDALHRLRFAIDEAKRELKPTERTK